MPTRSFITIVEVVRCYCEINLCVLGASLVYYVLCLLQGGCVVSTDDAWFVKEMCCCMGHKSQGWSGTLCFLVIWICIKEANQHSLIEQHSLGACNIGQHQEERGDMEETKEEETEKEDSDVSLQWACWFIPAGYVSAVVQIHWSISLLPNHYRKWRWTSGKPQVLIM